MMSLKVRFLFQKLNYIDKEEKHQSFQTLETLENNA